MGRRLAAIFLLCAAAGAALVLSARSPYVKVSAQDLLREATRDRGPLEKIFEQQASQGYYDDALTTARLAAASLPLRDQAYELSGLTEKLVQLRAENGDIPGAKGMVKQLSASALGDGGLRATRDIAKIQVDRGDLRGALATVVSPADTNQVMEEFGNFQIRKGDFDGALKTAEQVNERSAYNLFYAVGGALRERGEPQRLHELASHMTNKKRAAELVEAARFMLSPHIEMVRILRMGPCDTAWVDGNAGKFDDAYRLVEQNHCRYSDIALKQFPSDPAAAERELRKSPDKADISLGLANMSTASAKKGDTANAMRLLDSVRQLDGKQNYCLECVQEIAWAWTLEGQPKVVVDWARSLPLADEERGYALLGVAQALAHPRPK
ncbi:MAG: hypothetical protein WBC67_02570 [Candidatus Acidiferrales bacterium]